MGCDTLYSYQGIKLSVGPVFPNCLNFTTFLKYRLACLLASRSRVLLENLTDSQPVKKFSAFYWIRTFIAAFTSASHLFLSWVRSIQSISAIPLPEIHLNIILPSESGSSKWLFPSGFPTEPLYTLLPSPKRATYPAYLILLDLIIRTILGEEHRSSCSSLCSLHSHLTSSLLGPNIFLCTLFCSQTPSPCDPPSLWGTKFHTHTKQQA